MMKKEYTIYGLLCPVANQFKYVGVTEKSLDVRLDGHLADNAVTSKTQWLDSLKVLDKKPLPIILEKIIDSRSEALALESRWIAFGLSVGWPLTNTDIPDIDCVSAPYLLPTVDHPLSIFRENTLPSYITRKKRKGFRTWLYGIVTGGYVSDMILVWFKTRNSEVFPAWYIRTGEKEDGSIVYGSPASVPIFEDWTTQPTIEIMQGGEIPKAGESTPSNWTVVS